MCRRPSLHETIARLAGQPTLTQEDAEAAASIFLVDPATIQQMVAQWRASGRRTA